MNGPALKSMPAVAVQTEEDWTAKAAAFERYRRLYHAGKMGAIWSANGGYLVAPAAALRGQSYHLAEWMSAEDFCRQMGVNS